MEEAVRTQAFPTHKWAWFDFTLEEIPSSRRCSECHALIPIGDKMYVSRQGKRIAKRVCSEECGREFDYRMIAAQVWRKTHQII